MAGLTEVTVFVDEAVLGQLPSVCAKTGTPATGRVQFTEEVNRSGRLVLLWLLVLAGPAGWLILLALMVLAGGRGEELTVRLPYSDAAFDRYQSALRQRMQWAIVGIVACVAVLLLVVSSAATPLVVAASFVAFGAVPMTIVAEAAVRRSSVGIRLDASRRWVTLSGAHPAFVDACRARSDRDAQPR